MLQKGFDLHCFCVVCHRGAGLEALKVLLALGSRGIGAHQGEHVERRASIRRPVVERGRAVKVKVLERNSERSELVHRARRRLWYGHGRSSAEALSGRRRRKGRRMCNRPAVWSSACGALLEFCDASGRLRDSPWKQTSMAAPVNVSGSVVARTSDCRLWYA